MQWMAAAGGILFAAIDFGPGLLSPELEASGVLRACGKRRGEDVAVGSKHEGGFGV